MKFGGGLISRRFHLQWAALLALAVLLPTASLLWFMSRVIADERLVVQQKLAVLYQDKLNDATAATRDLCAARLAALDVIPPPANPYPLLRRLVLEENFSGVVVWDADGALNYPLSADPVVADAPPDSPLAGAMQQEFAKNDYAAAVRLYSEAAADLDPRVAVPALVGQSRCLSRLGRQTEAITACQKAAFTPLPDHPDPALLLAVENARLFLLSLLKDVAHSSAEVEIFHRTIDALAGDLFSTAGDRPLLPANQNLFIAGKVIDAMQKPVFTMDSSFTNRLMRLAAAEELSLAAAESSRNAVEPLDMFYPIGPEQPHIIAIRHRGPVSTVLLLASDTGLASFLAGYQRAFGGSESAYRILNASGRFVAGITDPSGKPFLTAALPNAFPGWKVELYFQGSDVFEKAARRQIAVYVWTAALVILLMLLVGTFALRAVSRQIRLNSMKNDFIATVSHELKTPLASMRLLVDTLLEGRVRDDAQVTEYLRLTAKENERLSRMIDNFLTFSRMERNRVAFALADARPADIARDAIESVKTKFAANDCHFTADIPTDLPDVQADHDAIVTVLVNLLDNACKYTNADKQVSLKISRADGRVCFAIADNGIGIARRHLRRIFDRFYQVDNSLSRKAEGCGLGLSIVKFIVDAHHGKITVESKPGHGSTFIVSLPANGRNGG